MKINKRLFDCDEYVVILLSYNLPLLFCFQNQCSEYIKKSNNSFSILSSTNKHNKHTQQTHVHSWTLRFVRIPHLPRKWQTLHPPWRQTNLHGQLQSLQPHHPTQKTSQTRLDTSMASPSQKGNEWNHHQETY